MSPISMTQVVHDTPPVKPCIRPVGFRALSLGFRVQDITYTNVAL